jgi:hypothetical protein
MTNPSNQQRDQLNSINESVEIVQFLAIKDSNNIGNYIEVAQRNVREFGGVQEHVLNIDQVLSGMGGKEINYSVLTINQFPSGTQLLKYYDDLAAERSAALASSYTLVLKPESNIQKVKRLRFLAPLLRLKFRIGEIGEFNEEVQLLQPERNATLEMISDFQTFDQEEPFYNINLNKHYPVPTDSKLSIDEYYAEFSAETARVTGPRVLSIGAFPTISGKIIQIFSRDKKEPFHDDWDQFLLVYYPKREDYLRLITHLPIEIIEKRNEAYERAIQMPCTQLNL